MVELSCGDYVQVAGSLLPTLILTLEGKHLCMRYGNNNHLASARLGRGCILWDNQKREWESGFGPVL